MIPRAHITAWRGTAPWLTDAQVEQDLALSRALVEIYADPILPNAFAFRGGTAFNKLYLRPPARYSEDIDLVQVKAPRVPGSLEPQDLARRVRGEPRRQDGRPGFHR
ncbi:MAG: nucleotidyl transferase AbiEii/AbiGii toxin family protein [Deltaproteobacteria bacterium]|nr:nucleotidyl transferase AbiEii/AbiGii toxin family protein [Deltaproteobacteria bacterium]